MRFKCVFLTETYLKRIEKKKGDVSKLMIVLNMGLVEFVVEDEAVAAIRK